MATLSESFSHLCKKTTLIIMFLFLQIIVLLYSICQSLCSSSNRLVANTQLLKLIEEKIPTVRYRKSGLNMKFKDCAVCLSNFEDGEEIRKLQCKHTFHKDCLDKWLHQDLYATCPLCRQEVLPEEIAAKYRQRSLSNHLAYDDGSDDDLAFFLSAVHDANNWHRLY